MVEPEVTSQPHEKDGRPGGEGEQAMEIQILRGPDREAVLVQDVDQGFEVESGRKGVRRRGR